jgi:hypothetical protein
LDHAQKKLTINQAFRLDDAATRRAFAQAYHETRALYYRGQPDFEALLGRIADNLERL